MTAKRLYFALVSLIVILAFCLLAGAKMASNELSNKSGHLVDLQLQQTGLDGEHSQLATAKADIQRYSSLASIAETIVPQDKNQAEAVREIVNIAGANQVSLSNIAFPQSSLGNASAKPAGSLNLSQLTPVKGLSGVYELPISIASDESNPISYNQFISFLEQLENNRRTSQVTNIELTPNPKNPSQLTFTLSINEYIKP